MLLSTTRFGMMVKLNFLNQFCNSHGMIVNISKTKFYVINGNEYDKEPMVVESMVVDLCEQYTYLGCIFTADGSISSSIKAEAKARMCHTLKFISFVNKNNDVPFYIKNMIFQLALLPTLTYGCESWFNGDMKPMNKLYLWSIKQLLGVRKTTITSVCLLELGLAEFHSFVKSKQRKFLSQAWADRSDMVDDPLAYVMKLCFDNNTPSSRYIRDIIDNDIDDIAQSLEKLKNEISMSDSNRILVYKSINPDLSVHPIYSSKVKVNELDRVKWSRMRLSSHSLAVEVGRWNRRGRGRLPMEERLCTCGQIQTEQHVVEVCPRTVNIRTQWNISSLHNLLTERTDYSNVCQIVRLILETFK